MYLEFKNLLIAQFWRDSDLEVPVDQSMVVLSNGIKVGMIINMIRSFKLRKMIQNNSIK
jgi:hypothetical protein